MTDKHYFYMCHKKTRTRQAQKSTKQIEYPKIITPFDIGVAYRTLEV